MKKSLYILFVAPLLLFSCKKDHTVPKTQSPKLYQVNFKVSNFTNQQGNFSLRQHTNSLKLSSLTSPGTYLDLLYYYVFDSNNNVVKQKYQDSTMADMGKITDSLPAGTYTLAIVAGKKTLSIRDDGFGPYFYYPNNHWQDTFYDSFQLTVGSSNINQDITLTRDVGKLEVQLLDNTLPSTVDSLVVHVYGDVANKTLIDGRSSGLPSQAQPVTYSFLIPASAKNKPGFTADMIIASPQDVYVDIAYKDSNNKLIFVPNTYMLAAFNLNTTMVLSGYLFPDNQSPQTFLVKADTAWNSATTQVNFSRKR